MFHISDIINHLQRNLYFLIIILFLLANAFLEIYFYYYPKEQEKIVDNIELKEEKESEEDNNKITTIKVDIKGQVTNPGVYEIASGSIVQDLIVQAGGLKKNATTSNINLSKALENEMVIIIYTESELKKKATVAETNCSSVEINNCQSKEEVTSIINGNGTSANNNQNSKISINTASVSELINLPGIGEAKAQAIIDYRNTNGSFETIEDIKKVSGIGDSTFAQIKDYITI